MTNGKEILTSGGRWRLNAGVAAAADGSVVITLAGRVPAAEARRLATLLDEAGRQSARIVLNLQEIDYISSPGILALQGAAAGLRARGGNLVLTGVTPAVRTVLELAGAELHGA